MSSPRLLRHVPLGRADYGETLALQRTLHAKRCAGEIDDLILSVEHNPVFTLGRSGSRTNLLVDDDTLRANGIEVYDVERGGDITYHGPGQLVAYPILDLRGFGKDIHRFVWSLEEGILRTLGALQISGRRRDGFPGVWIGERKVASVGVYVKNWVTYHGLAFNIQVNQEHFRMIRPCGLPVETTSVNDLRPSPIELHDVRALLVRELGALLERDVVEVRREELV